MNKQAVENNIGQDDTFLFLAFATGTSWGTFGILIPIVLAIVANDNNLMVMTVAAVLAGAVITDRKSTRLNSSHL